MDERLTEFESYRLQQIRELDLEELQIEEVEGLHDTDGDADDNAMEHENLETGSSGGITFNPCVAALHTYLGEVEDTQHGLVFLEGGAILSLPLLYLEGVVLFPEATLPLRLIHPNFIACVHKAITQADAPDTIGVVRVFMENSDGRIRFSTVGTTAKIRQRRRLDDGSLNLVTRGQQRFRVRRRWIDEDGVPCGEVQIIKEDSPLRAPRDAFGKLPPVRIGETLAPSSSSNIPCAENGDEECSSDERSSSSFEGELSSGEMRIHRSAVMQSSCCAYDTIDGSTSSDEERFVCESELQRGAPAPAKASRSLFSDDEISVRLRRRRTFHGVASAFWPYWVYSMYDSYSLARKASGMWKKVVGSPSMDCLARDPGLLSFSIASKLPVSEAVRQELLEIDGISYRLQRVIKLLEGCDRVRCRSCQSVIGRRSDMLVMSSEGPLGAYVNPHGFVHQVLTLDRVSGLLLYGRATEAYSWFPGYAWTVANCSTCETQIGWMFTAVHKEMCPNLFWAIRSSQVADDMR